MENFDVGDEVEYYSKQHRCILTGEIRKSTRVVCWGKIVTRYLFDVTMNPNEIRLATRGKIHIQYHITFQDRTLVVKVLKKFGEK